MLEEKEDQVETILGVEPEDPDQGKGKGLGLAKENIRGHLTEEDRDQATGKDMKILQVVDPKTTLEEIADPDPSKEKVQQAETERAS